MKNINLFNKKWWPFILFGAGLMVIVPSTYAEESVRSESTRSTTTESVTVEQGGAVKSAPAFQEVDKNGDHYVTKDELEGYPDLLKYFDEVDAGKTGRLEEHEYGNLVMEKRRERGR